jgi:putative ATPase
MTRPREERTGSLFPGDRLSTGPDERDPVTEPRPDAPLADRVRPRTLDEILGQEEVLGPGRPLRRAIEQDQLRSLILWGPPGSGKTTLAFVIRRLTRAHFEAMSAVLSGVKEVREVLRAAEERRRREGRRTVVFIDEIHRFNKAQQDALLAHVESGDIVLIGATTENPSFEVNAALLSRSRVVVLKPLGGEELVRVLRQALAAPERGLGEWQAEADEAALAFLAGAADGDARTALNVLELAVTTASPGEDGRRRVDLPAMQQAFARKALLYDKGGEEHFNIISALHKSIRNSDADAGLYWLARMLEAGEDPLYVARRLVRFASEDVGMGDPQALVVAMAAQQAVHFIGLPEGALALAELVVYLAAAPKSNALYLAYGEASRDALETRAEPVPLWIRNAPTGLMKDLGYGRGYRYAHDEADGVAGMDCLPGGLAGRRYYRPTDRGREKDVAARLEAARLIRERKKAPPPRG